MSEKSNDYEDYEAQEFKAAQKQRVAETLLDWLLETNAHEYCCNSDDSNSYRLEESAYVRGYNDFRNSAMEIVITAALGDEEEDDDDCECDE